MYPYGLVICLERGADLHMAQLMPLPLTVSCFSKIQIVFFTFLVPAHPGTPDKGSSTVAALHQGAPGQMSWLEDPPPCLRCAYCFASVIV